MSALAETLKPKGQHAPKAGVWEDGTCVAFLFSRFCHVRPIELGERIIIRIDALRSLFINISKVRPVIRNLAAFIFVPAVAIPPNGCLQACLR